MEKWDRLGPWRTMYKGVWNYMYEFLTMKKKNKNKTVTYKHIVYLLVTPA